MCSKQQSGENRLNLRMFLIKSPLPLLLPVVRFLARLQETLRNFGLDEAQTFLEQAQSLEVCMYTCTCVTALKHGSKMDMDPNFKI